MDFSVLKSEEKIKPFANYMSPSSMKGEKNEKPQKFSGSGSVEKINFKENNGKSEEPHEKSYSNHVLMTPENNKLSSYDMNKISDRNTMTGPKNENLMGEKGAKIIDNDTVFKNENEYTMQDICRICENDLVKTGNEKKNWFFYFSSIFFSLYSSGISHFL